MNVEKPSKPPHQLAKARSLLEEVSFLYAAKGKKTITIDLKTEVVDDEVIHKFMLGPTGNLRAPAMTIGKTLLVGFNQELYERVFG
ncbi:MAG: hypothetical protein MK324_17825 [Pirellulales bacterium]|nr:hypothetical protein [Rhodopirellula sp.]MCH2372360.1 hypothetical protein [Pirellulales bacterium]|tara:strand:+ start:1590 stop:1847 length:258 start_codon:yes stop_codon:yes gene_type:complete